MATIIPFDPGVPEQPIAIVLDGIAYIMRARWNSRDDEDNGAWYLDVWERDGVTRIAVSLKLVLGVRIGRNVPHPLFRSGLILVDGRGPDDPYRGGEPRLNDLGGVVTLWHMNAADIVLASLPQV